MKIKRTKGGWAIYSGFCRLGECKDKATAVEVAADYTNDNFKAV